MSDRTFEISVDGRSVTARDGATVASVLLEHGTLAFRRSVRGEARGPLCGMGICHECRVTIDDVAHQRACMVISAPGMRVETAASVPAASPWLDNGARQR